MGAEQAARLGLESGDSSYRKQEPDHYNPRGISPVLEIKKMMGGTTTLRWDEHFVGAQQAVRLGLKGGPRKFVLSDT